MTHQRPRSLSKWSAASLPPLTDVGSLAWVRPQTQRKPFTTPLTSSKVKPPEQVKGHTSPAHQSPARLGRALGRVMAPQKSGRVLYRLTEIYHTEILCRFGGCRSRQGTRKSQSSAWVCKPMLRNPLPIGENRFLSYSVRPSLYPSWEGQ